MKTVYVVNKSGHDFTAAEKFGELVYLTEGIVEWSGVTKMYRMFAAGLETSKPGDFILLTGLSVMNVVACSCFAYKHGKINLLLWNKDMYISRSLKLGELIERGGE